MAPDASFGAAGAERVTEGIEVIAPSSSPRAHLVVIPGAGGFGAAFRSRVAPLAGAGVAVSLYDPPGHGGRFLAFTFGRARDELAAHCRDFAPVPRFVLAHSM